MRTRGEGPLAADRAVPALAGVGHEGLARAGRHASLRQIGEATRGEAGEPDHPDHERRQPERAQRGRREADEPDAERAASAVVDEDLRLVTTGRPRGGGLGACASTLCGEAVHARQNLR